MIEPLPSRTMYVPMTEVTMHRPPMISGRLISFSSMSLRAAGDGQRDRHHGDAERDDISFEQVGGHAGAVADIVTDVVGDGRRIAGIVFGNSGLDLADQVGADVGGLGEDTAAKTGEDRNQRCAECEGDKGVDDDAVVGRVACNRRQIVKEDRDREQAEAGDEHAGDRSRAKRHGQAALQRRPRRLGSANIGLHRHVHADEASQARQ